MSGRVCIVICAFVALICGGSGASAAADAGPGKYEPTRASLSRHPLPEWWRDAKFGIFIHWGPLSTPAWNVPGTMGGFWYWFEQQKPGTPAWSHHLEKYGQDVLFDDLIPQFTASRYDPDAWARLFKRAGAKYFILTTKHHDGFALWPSATSQRDAGDMAPHRDLVGPLVDAARKRDLKVGLYYSIPEWFSPAPRPTGANVADDVAGQEPSATALVGDAAFNDKPRNAYTGEEVPYTGYVELKDYAAGQVRPQVRELIQRYRPDEIWCDIGGAESYFRSNEWIAEYYNEAAKTNPEGVVVNDRCGSGGTHRDYPVVEQGNSYSLGEQSVAKPSETARSIGNWFYSAEEGEADLPTPATLVHELVTAVSNNSNYVLNVGPRADGTIPELMTDRFEALGAWLELNGEAIYGTRPWTQAADDNNANLRFTVGKRGAFYLTSLGWPGKEVRVAAPVPIEPDSEVVLLGSNGRPLAWRLEGTELVVQMPSGGAQRSATKSEHGFVLRIARPAASHRRGDRRLDLHARWLRTSVPSLRRRGLAVRASCQEPCALTGALSLDARTARKLGLGQRVTRVARTVRRNARGRVTLRLRPNREARAAMRGVKRLRLTLTLTATTADGRRAGLRRTLTVTRAGHRTRRGS